MNGGKVVTATVYNGRRLGGLRRRGEPDDDRGRLEEVFSGGVGSGDRVTFGREVVFASGLVSAASGVQRRLRDHLQRRDGGRGDGPGPAASSSSSRAGR